MLCLQPIIYSGAIRRTSGVAQDVGKHGGVSGAIMAGWEEPAVLVIVKAALYCRIGLEDGKCAAVTENVEEHHGRL